MPRFLDIIVPEYECSEFFLRRLLDSICRQKKVNFNEIGIIIVDDNSKNKIRKSVFRNYPQLSIDYYYKEKNDGESITRQYGLDRSVAEYVTFVDQDDELYGTDSLGIVIDYLRKNNPECVLSGYIEEHENGVVEHLDFDIAESLHGVFIKRESLKINEIAFLPNVRYHDDYHFRRLLLISMNPIHIKVHTYLWHHNFDSTVRKERKYEYLVETFGDWLTATKEIYDYIDKKKAGQSKYIISTIYNLFFVLESQFFNYEELKDKRASYEKELYALICKYFYHYSNNEKYLKNIKKESYDSIVGTFGRNIDLNYSFDEFVDLMEETYPEIKRVEKKKEILLDIIIPYYNESYELIKHLLNSIYNQNIVNFEEIQVSLVNDNPKNVLDDLLLENDFPYLEIVHYKKNKNDGPGLSRQYALDRSVAKYVTFFDADDLMYGRDSLYKVLYCLKTGDYEVLYTNFLTIYKDKTILASFKDLICLHGSFYNRSILNKNDIRFSDKLFLFEDMYFCSITNMCLESKYLDYITYIWVRREESLSQIENSDINASLKTRLSDFVKSNLLILDFGMNNIDLMKRKFIKANLDCNLMISEFLISKLFYLFVVIESDVFYERDISEYERRIYEKYLELKVYYDYLSDLDRKRIFDSQVKVVVNDTHAREIRRSFEDFIQIK